MRTVHRDSFRERSMTPTSLAIFARARGGGRRALVRQVRDVDEESAQRGQRHLETCRTRTATVRRRQDLSKCKLACFKSLAVSSDRQTQTDRHETANVQL